MKMIFPDIRFAFPLLMIGMALSCGERNDRPSIEAINAINLKKGDLISCGSPDKQFGSVVFDISGNPTSKTYFNLAIELLHSFEYDEAEKVFAKIIDEEPDCAMAYWGVAMCNWHPLWEAPSDVQLKKGAKALEIARSIQRRSAREGGFIDALSSFYTDWDKVDLHTRAVRFEKAMERISLANPNDKEAAIFYALALDAAANPADKSFVNQKKAGTILQALYPNQPDHPGIAHYLIHTYDYPELAVLALPAARKYAAIAPSSAHAIHMPSHIFTRLGLWDECIQSNLASMDAARCYAETAGFKGHWDEELHGMDYLVYAYLQKGENGLAREQCAYLQTIKEVYPVDFKDAYAFAAIPARYVLENRMWKEAAALQLRPEGFPWDKFPWQKAINCFARLLGDAHLGNRGSAALEYKRLQAIHDTLTRQKDGYKAKQVQIQLKTSEAWMALMEGKGDDAIAIMNVAADMEDSTQKHPVTPGEVIPARELLGDMLLERNQPAKALEAYESDLKRHPNRFNGLYGAGRSAERSGDRAKAGFYYRLLLNITGSGKSDRPELIRAKLFLKKVGAD